MVKHTSYVSSWNLGFLISITTEFIHTKNNMHNSSVTSSFTFKIFNASPSSVCVYQPKNKSWIIEVDNKHGRSNNYVCAPATKLSSLCTNFFKCDAIISNEHK